MAHIRQSRPDSGLDVQVKDLKTLYVVPSSHLSGARAEFDEGDAMLAQRVLPQPHPHPNLWEGYNESRRCSRDTYPESYITKNTSIRRIWHTKDSYG